MLIQLPIAGLALLCSVLGAICLYFIKKLVDKSSEMGENWNCVLQKLEGIEECVKEFPSVKQDVAVLKFVVFNKNRRSNGHPKMDDSVLDDSE